MHVVDNNINGYPHLVINSYALLIKDGQKVKKLGLSGGNQKSLVFILKLSTIVFYKLRVIHEKMSY